MLWIRGGGVGIARSVIEVPLEELVGRDVDHMERRLLKSSLESRVLILDLGHVEFICAEGWAALARARRQIVAGGGDVHLHSLRPEVARAFEALRLDREFKLVELV
jgi:anti-anti-sigma factor